MKRTRFARGAAIVAVITALGAVGLFALGGEGAGVLSAPSEDRTGRTPSPYIGDSLDEVRNSIIHYEIYFYGLDGRGVGHETISEVRVHVGSDGTAERYYVSIRKAFPSSTVDLELGEQGCYEVADGLVPSVVKRDRLPLYGWVAGGAFDFANLAMLSTDTAGGDVRATLPTVPELSTPYHSTETLSNGNTLTRSLSVDPATGRMIGWHSTLRSADGVPLTDTIAIYGPVTVRDATGQIDPLVESKLQGGCHDED